MIAKVPAQLRVCRHADANVIAGGSLVSVDHFRHELLAQMNRAVEHGSIVTVINSGELYRSLGGYPGSMHGMPACCEAMRSEMKPGDILLVEQASGPAMTARYRLPRPMKPRPMGTIKGRGQLGGRLSR
jgi:hypothetical protein